MLLRVTSRAWVLLVVLAVALGAFVAVRPRLWRPALVVALALALAWALGAL